MSDRTRGLPWYQGYDERRQHLSDLQQEYRERAASLGHKPRILDPDFWFDSVVRAVRESNWQEGIYVTERQTRRFARAAATAQKTTGTVPGFDTARILAEHRAYIATMAADETTPEGLGTFNLGIAHSILNDLCGIIASRDNARMLKDIVGVALATLRRPILTPEETTKALDDLELYRRQIEDPTTATGRYHAGPPTLGQETKALLTLPRECLEHPFEEEHVHLLHSIALMGIVADDELGAYRSGPVNVGDPDVHFPNAAEVPERMKAFCRDFPTPLPVVEYDEVRAAATASHAFVSIHPYSQGNGRMSRLLMNLVLYGQYHPPVYIPANARGRHRYKLALEKADRGDIEPMACLVASSLSERYEVAIDRLKRGDWTTTRSEEIEPQDEQP